MAPALVAVGTYALLLAWNEYLYQFLLLSSKNSMTVSVALAQFVNKDVRHRPTNVAAAIISRFAGRVYYAVRRHWPPASPLAVSKGSGLA